jgi:lipoprotein-anchoring transpeptidase ErfK/SrfK
MRWQVGLATAMLLTAGQSALAEDAGGSGAARAQVVASVASVGDGAKAPAVEAGQKVATVERPVPASAARAPVTHPAPPTKHVRPQSSRSTLVARIDLTSQRMHVTANGKAVGSWKISSGRSGYETPRGQFRPKWISRMHYSRKYYNSPMPYSVFFNGGIATHGTTAVSRLGRPASHGCIRLRTANARKFYNLVREHGKARTRIIVTGYAEQSRVVERSQPRKRQTSSRRNAFDSNSSGRRRYSVNEYERRYQQRVRRYHQSRRMAWPGDRY